MGQGGTADALEFHCASRDLRLWVCLSTLNTGLLQVPWADVTRREHPNISSYALCPLLW